MNVTPSLSRRLAVAALVLCAIAAAMITALVATANGSVRTAEPAPAAVEVAPAMHAVQAAPVDPFLVILAPGTDFAPEQAQELTYAADRVCEGQTAEVPVPVMVDTLVRDQGMTLDEATHFVNTALSVHC